MNSTEIKISKEKKLYCEIIYLRSENKKEMYFLFIVRWNLKIDKNKLNILDFNMKMVDKLT